MIYSLFDFILFILNPSVSSSESLFNLFFLMLSLITGEYKTKNTNTLVFPKPRYHFCKRLEHSVSIFVYWLRSINKTYGTYM